MKSQKTEKAMAASTLKPLLASAILALPLATPPGQAASVSYTFTRIATLGEAAPGPQGGTFINDFEPGGLNSRGDMAFGADASSGGEAVFLRQDGQIIQLGRTGDAAPGGGTFEFGFLGPVGLNDQGETVYAFLLKDFTSPFGVNAGLYRFSPATGSITPVVIPYVTPAPGGGTFQGASFQPTINNRGDVAFPGLIVTDQGVHNVPDNGEPYVGLGIGVFRSDSAGVISSVVSPGDAAPGGGTFDYAAEPWINDGGEVSFIGHISGEESVVAGFPPQADLISALTGVYLKTSGGVIRTVVHPGDPAPGGGNFRGAFHDVMNNLDQIAFNGDLTPPPDANQVIGVFRYADDQVTLIARPGDPMPGGGNLVNSSIVGGNVHINNRGDIVFSGIVDTDADADGFPDTGLFRWSGGELSEIVRTGTVIPGIGTVDELASPQLVVPPSPIPTTTSGAINNDAGEVLFQATLADGSGVLLLATPAPGKARGRNPNPGIIRPGSTYRGLSYGEWAALWWSQLFSIPIVDGDHPFFSGGAFGGDQKVVFLTAIGGGAVVDVSVPQGTALFFPVVNSECSVIEPDPFHGDDEASLRACANGHIDHTSALFAEIDGVPVSNLAAYRVESPLFEFGPLPEDNIFSEPAGTTSASVDAGVYLLLAPLNPGGHTIHVGGTFDQMGFSIDTIFHVTVE